MSLRRPSRKITPLLAILLLAIQGPAWPQASAQANYVRYQEPQFLTFDELKSLSLDPNPRGKLRDKLEAFWTTPVISNEAYYNGAKPHLPSHPKLGPYLRAVSWNIEKSLNMNEVIRMWTDKSAAEAMVDTAKAPKGSRDYNFVLYQRDRLLTADLIFLQEMDIGVKRSGYINAAAELAKALNMNYTYGASQLEIDPAVLGLEEIRLVTGETDIEAQNYYRVDPDQYKGVFGSAVLSRYPIKNVEVFQLKNQAYDWYWEEKKQTAFLERARRFGSRTVFLNEITREMKVGGRIYMRVDLDVPHLPGGTLTVINIHLEIKCQPRGRQHQMREILSYIKGIRNPVIVAGDFNSAPTDLSPTSVARVVKRAAKDPTMWFSAGISYLTPYGMVVNPTRAVSNVTKNFQNPLARHIPIVAPNHVRSLFMSIHNFRFDDGRAFDFRGNRERSINGKSEILANSNQRDLKGFKTTFQVVRPLAKHIGKYRLDWFFVKSFLTDPRDDHGPYRFAPHFGETLEELNTSVAPRLSDHHPNVIDLPFREPKIPRP